MLYYDVHTHLTSNHPSAVSILNVIRDKPFESFFGRHTSMVCKDAYIGLHKQLQIRIVLLLVNADWIILNLILILQNKKYFIVSLNWQNNFQTRDLHVVRSNNELFHILKDFPVSIYLAWIHRKY